MFGCEVCNKFINTKYTARGKTVCRKCYYGLTGTKEPDRRLMNENYRKLIDIENKKEHK